MASSDVPIHPCIQRRFTHGEVPPLNEVWHAQYNNIPLFSCHQIQHVKLDWLFGTVCRVLRRIKFQKTSFIHSHLSCDMSKASFLFVPSYVSFPDIISNCSFRLTFFPSFSFYLPFSYTPNKTIPNICLNVLTYVPISLLWFIQQVLIIFFFVHFQKNNVSFVTLSSYLIERENIKIIKL